MENRSFGASTDGMGNVSDVELPIGEKPPSPQRIRASTGTVQNGESHQRANGSPIQPRRPRVTAASAWKPHLKSMSDQLLRANNELPHPTKVANNDV